MKTILVDAVDCFVIEKNENNFVIFQDMFDLLEKYSNKKIILTGADDEKFKVYKLDKMPYEVFTLKHNPEKTNSEYYKILFKKYSLQNDDVIYFEHNIEAVKSAQSVGIKTYFYDNKKEDLESLEGFLNENLK